MMIETINQSHTKHAHLVSILDTSRMTRGQISSRLKACRFSHSVCSSSDPDATYSYTALLKQLKGVSHTGMVGIRAVQF
jgi:hypothetical protein